MSLEEEGRTTARGTGSLEGLGSPLGLPVLVFAVAGWSIAIRVRIVEIISATEHFPGAKHISVLLDFERSSK